MRTKTKGESGTSMRDRYLMAAGGVVALALVVTVGSALAPSPSVKPASDRGASSEAFVVRAREALDSGETTEAARLAQRALALDSGNQAAKEILQETEANTAAEPQRAGDGSSEDDQSEAPASGEQADPHEGFSEPLDDARVLLPEKFSAFDLATTVADERSAMVSASPAEASRGVSRITWTVREMDSRKAAESFLNKTSKTLYAEDPDSVSVDGAAAYVGTDGTRYASCSYVRGLYVFEVLVTADQVAPKDVLPEAIRAAKAFADRP